MSATYTHKFTLKDGSTATHTAEALRYWLASDGSVVVEAACCGLIGGIVDCPDCTDDSCARCGGSGKIKGEDTRSRHTFYDVGRPVAVPDGNGVTTVTQIDPEAEVRAHVQRVAEHHAAVHRARSFSLDALMKPPAVAGELPAK